MTLSPAFRSQNALAAWSPDGEILATVTENLVQSALSPSQIVTGAARSTRAFCRSSPLVGLQILFTYSLCRTVGSRVQPQRQILGCLHQRFGVFSETAECGEARQSFFSVVGKPFAVHSRLLVYHVTGEVLFKFEPPAEPLGIRQLQMHAKVGLLIASGYDETIRVFSLLDWTEVFPPLHHREKMPIGPHVLVVREELNECQERSPTGISDRLESRETATWEARSRAPVVYRQLGPSQETRDGTDGSGEENQRPSEDWRPRRKNARMQGREETEAEGGKSEGERGKDAEPEEREKNDPRRNRDKKTPKPFIALPTEKIADVRLGSPERDRRGGPARPRLREAGSCGVAVAVPSPCGAFLASQHARQPRVVYVWSLQTGDLVSLVLHRSLISSFAWNPHPAAYGDTACREA
ncbi:conserved hypothetical protein [Neospora caninum Liverpool]|uniref:Uncharacterized protein n=1 Tax=Neospora caninum (strain Liverpool) TaxID=572307 RepID=F0VP62_NEOCL|nr:conserved hypothetical protein [Neospora caninum Liverpool]CBZ55508.1 conserved hypothetical protein [Neospora caninum Liverpool]|eukprot:XP_003885536.1 conserved hypothetical protein [Neospora caninum Liverpool]